MKNSAIVANVTKSLHKVGYKLEKHSPEIFLAVGVVGTVASAVMACKATTKVSDILAESKEQVDAVHTLKENKELAQEKGYSEEDSKKDLALIYAQTGVKLVKLYAPSVILGALSIGCTVASHNIMRKRNIALGAAYATLDQGYKQYRSRVVERFGENVDRELKYNIKAQKVTETVVDEETGKEKKIKTTVDVVDSFGYSGYSRVFDEGNPLWEKNADVNKHFLVAQQNWFNDKLQRNGRVYLNEVYKALGFEETDYGQVVGWDLNSPNSDGYIDFGLFDIRRETVRDFVNGYERSIILDFNHDGIIVNI